MRVLHVVSVLQSGGIETMLYRYLHYMKDRNITFEIMTHDENEQGMLYQRLPTVRMMSFMFIKAICHVSLY